MQRHVAVCIQTGGQSNSCFKSLMFKVMELGKRHGRYHTLGSPRSQLLGEYFNAINSLGSALRINIIKEVNKAKLNKGDVTLQFSHFYDIFNRIPWS